MSAAQGIMRCVFALLIALLLFPASAGAAAPKLDELTSRGAVLGWMWAYRASPNPDGVPIAMKAASRLGLLRDPESSGVFVGFLAGVIGANPVKAEALLMKTLPLPVEDQWLVVRAIAYSAAPEWKTLLQKVGPQLPARKAMLDKQIAGKLPTLDQLDMEDGPAWYQRAWQTVRVDKYFRKKDTAEKPARLEASGDIIDTYWGYYFATGAYSPIARIVALTRWSKDREEVEKLSIGSMAKYTLATNATRDPAILAHLHWAAKQEHPKEVKAALTEVVEAAETAGDRPYPQGSVWRGRRPPAQGPGLAPRRRAVEQGRRRGDLARLPGRRGHRSGPIRPSLCGRRCAHLRDAALLGHAGIRPGTLARGFRGGRLFGKNAGERRRF